MLDVNVRFENKDATVRYLPGQVTLDQILKRFEDTPFGVTLAGPVVTFTDTGQVVLRGWTERTKADAPKTIQLFVETVVKESSQVTIDPDFSFADPPAEGLTALDEFQKAEITTESTKKLVIRRFVAHL